MSRQQNKASDSVEARHAPNRFSREFLSRKSPAEAGLRRVSDGGVQFRRQTTCQSRPVPVFYRL
jgi:hypothetical protein